MSRQRPYRWRGRRQATAMSGEPLGQALLAMLEAMGGSPERAGLQRLWDNWAEVLGEELAALARPLGQHAARRQGRVAGGAQLSGAVLLLAAEDAMLLQELRFRGEEILERVNGYLGHAFFSRVQVSLPLGRSAPVRTRRPWKPEAATSGERAPATAATGVFLAGMDAASPVARCYARFARRKEAQDSPGETRPRGSAETEG